MGARQGLPTSRRGLGRGRRPGGRSARGPPVRVWCGSGRDAQPSGLGRMGQARDFPFTRSGLGLGVRPRGRSARRYSAGAGGMLGSLDLAGCLGPGSTRDARSLFLSSHPSLRNGLGLGVRPRVAEAAGGMLGLLDLAGRHQPPFDPAASLPPPGVDWVWGAVLGSRAGPKRELEGLWGLRTPRCAVHPLPRGCPRIAAVGTRP